MTVLPMIAATYFMVAGGPYGLEEIVQKTGYTATLLILMITPLLWSVPVAMMVSELATSIPEEGGFYIWVRRGMGPFWGYQETWLTLAGSVFEMALYPNLFVDYLGRLSPAMVAGHRGLVLGFLMIAMCTAWNILGADAVGEGSFVLNIALLLPFVALVDIRAAQRTRGGERWSRRHSAATCRSAGRHPDRHVELHGLGQSLDHRGRSLRAAENLLARDARRRHSRHRQLSDPGRRGGAHRRRSRTAGPRAAGSTSARF